MDEAEDRSLSSAGESEGPEEDEVISDEEDDGDEDDEEEDSDEEEASSVSSSACGNARPLEIVVKRVGKGDNNVLSLQVDPSASVLDLKTQISQELAAKDNNDRIPVDRQRLIYFGRMLRDNEEILGNEGIKMKPKVVNYVHLSALPEGQKPSPRDNNHHRHRGGLRPSPGGLPIPAAFSFASRPATAIAGSSTSMQESHQQSVERARRLGVASRERRRRRQNHPYGELARRVPGGITSSTSSTSLTERAGNGSHHPSVSSTHPEGPRLDEVIAATVPVVGPTSATTVEAGLHGTSGLFPLPTSSARQAVLDGSTLLSAFPSSQAPEAPSAASSYHRSPFARFSHLASAVSAEAQAAMSIADSHHFMLQQAQALSSELAPFLPVLEERLRQVSNSGTGVGSALRSPSRSTAAGGLDVADMINLLDHISRESSALALLLRRLPPDAVTALVGGGVASPAPAGTGGLVTSSTPLSALTPTIAFEQVLSAANPAIYIPQGPSLLFPAATGNWFPPMP